MARQDSKAKEQLLKRMKKGMDKSSGYETTSIFKPGLDLEFWAPKVGEKHWIDIIVYKAGKHDPDVDEGVETYCFQPYIHKNVGPNNSDVICLAKTYNKNCAICEYVKKLINDGAEEDEIDELKVQRNPRAIYNVHVITSKDEKKKGVRIFHASHWTIERHLLELATTASRPDEDEIDPFVYFPSKDKDGKSISFKREDKFNFVAHSFHDRKYEISKELLESAYTLDEVVIIPTFEEQEKILFGEGDDEEETTTKTTDDEPKKNSVDDESGEEEETEESEGLKGLDRQGLKKYIKDNKLGIRVTSEMEDEDVVKAIEEAEGGESSDGEDCPHGHVFGKDNDEKPECEDCPDDVWKACSIKCEEMNG